MRATLILFCILTLTSCQQNAQQKVPQPEQETTKNIGKEPTEPEATEFYEPVPPKVVIGQDGVPSDAIVLFLLSKHDGYYQ